MFGGCWEMYSWSKTEPRKLQVKHLHTSTRSMHGDMWPYFFLFFSVNGEIFAFGRDNEHLCAFRSCWKLAADVMIFPSSESCLISSTRQHQTHILYLQPDAARSSTITIMTIERFPKKRCVQFMVGPWRHVRWSTVCSLMRKTDEIIF